MCTGLGPSNSGSNTIKNYNLEIFLVILTLAVGCKATENNDYDRREFGFKSYTLDPQKGFYTDVFCAKVDVEHIVSFKDAFDSGAAAWTRDRKKQFANDRINHVPACASVNRSKGASLPAGFLRKSRDGKGRDYDIVRWCGYLARYLKAKTKYQLSMANNDAVLFRACDLNL